MISKTFNTDYAFNASVIYPGIKGTCKCSDSSFYANMQYGTYPLLNLNHRTLGSEDVYFKMKSINDKTISVLSQPILAFHPVRCVQFINYFCRPSTTVNGDYADLSFQILFNDSIMKDEYIAVINPFLTVEEIYLCGSDDIFLQNCVKFNMLMMFFGRLMGFSCVNSVSSNPLRGRIPATKGSGIWYESLLHYLTNLCSNSEKYEYTDNLFLKNMSDSLDNITLSDIRNLYTNVISMSNGSGLYTTLKDSVRSCCEFINDPLGVIQLNGTDDFSANSVITRYKYTDIVDVLPTDNICQIPEYDVTQLAAASLIVASIITASIVGTKRIISIVGAKRDLHKTKRIAKLNEYRDRYLKDPSKENYQAYSNALSNYKFKSSLFGWGSYDVTNGWYDGVSNVSGVAFNVNSIQYGINEIKTLIV